MSMMARNLERLHPVLRQLYNELSREDGYLGSGDNWVEFLSADADVLASIKGGESRVRIRAYPLDHYLGDASDDEIFSWVANQPRPATGVVQALNEEQEDGSTKLVPRIVFERPVEGFSTDSIDDDILWFADAWESRTIAQTPGRVVLQRGDPAESVPQNAWLLMGDDASFPVRAELDEMQVEGDVGIYDTLWTAPKNGALGDLVVLYFTAPRKSAHFVARLASRPFWRTDLDVGADKAVDSHQWWAHITPLIEIEPIPFRQLQDACGGFLVLKGKSGHSLSADAIKSLNFVARRPQDQAEVERLTQRPSGHPELPDVEAMSLDEWKTIPNGLLQLEAHVSQFIVKPLSRLIGEANRFPALRPTLVAEHKNAAGVVDFVMFAGDVPLVAIEVKLATQRPISGVWSESPSFRQLQRYMNAIDVPGLLIDVHGILVLSPHADAPTMEIVRAHATQDDIEQLQELLFAEAHQKFGGTGGIPEDAFAPRQAKAEPGLYMAYLPVEKGREVPVVILRGTSPSAPATEALPLIDSPVFRDIAAQFLQGEGMESVAERYLGGSLLDPHGVATVLGQTLPDERPELLEMLGGLYAPRNRPGRRRIARRG